MKTNYSFMLCKLKFMYKNRNHNILPVTNLYILKTLKIFFDGSGDSKLCDFRRLSRNKLNVIVSKLNLTVFRKFYLFLDQMFFNRLPTSIVDCQIKK